MSGGVGSAIQILLGRYDRVHQDYSRLANSISPKAGAARPGAVAGVRVGGSAASTTFVQTNYEFRPGGIMNSGSPIKFDVRRTAVVNPANSTLYGTAGLSPMIQKLDLDKGMPHDMMTVELLQRDG